MAKLVIDNREMKSRQKSAKSFFEDEGYDVEVDKLIIGDYLFDNKVVFEYKSPADVIQSIIDNRVFKQAERMKQYPFSYVIIVGNVAEEINQRNQQYWNRRNQFRQFTVKNYLGGLARLYVDSKVIHLDNRQQAWVLMHYLVSKLLDENKHIKGIDKPTVKLSDPVATFLSCIYVNDSSRLGIKTAVMIREYLHLESLRDLLDVTFEDLVSVKGVGVKTAKKIMEVLE